MCYGTTTIHSCCGFTATTISERCPYYDPEPSHRILGGVETTDELCPTCTARQAEYDEAIQERRTRQEEFKEWVEGDRPFPVHDGEEMETACRAAYDSGHRLHPFTDLVQIEDIERTVERDLGYLSDADPVDLGERLRQRVHLTEEMFNQQYQLDARHQFPTAEDLNRLSWRVVNDLVTREELLRLRTGENKKPSPMAIIGPAREAIDGNDNIELPSNLGFRYFQVFVLERNNPETLTRGNALEAVAWQRLSSVRGPSPDVLFNEDLDAYERHLQLSEGGRRELRYFRMWREESFEVEIQNFDFQPFLSGLETFLGWWNAHRSQLIERLTFAHRDVFYTAVVEYGQYLCDNDDRLGPLDCELLMRARSTRCMMFRSSIRKFNSEEYLNPRDPAEYDTTWPAVNGEKQRWAFAVELQRIVLWVIEEHLLEYFTYIADDNALESYRPPQISNPAISRFQLRDLHDMQRRRYVAYLNEMELEPVNDLFWVEIPWGIQNRNGNNETSGNDEGDNQEAEEGNEQDALGSNREA